VSSGYRSWSWLTVGEDRRRLFSSGSPFDQLLISASSPASVRWGQRLALSALSAIGMHLQLDYASNLIQEPIAAQTVMRSVLMTGLLARMDVLTGSRFQLGKIRSFVSALEPSVVCLLELLRLTGHMICLVMRMQL